ncbi:MAG: hypothetical protein LPK20_02595 [Halomonas sp.]|jgi:hypothetical protein|uniref:HTH luxR-type domain-containing protein n=1 Tax=Billgrantia tianxiuensis TaxID=2497861 RepID=A0A6I6SE90_9GAMM|nr:MULTISPECIES: hypothetical protein [Halomonas]MCE8033171.1 hypothetical protein [Halomonas sp. MCCC 1A11057]MDX5432446.1 hypothetical protein [Halomonas sp.]QHC48928.1 hypothetical protein EKK97_03950 [Halomonas tianxiuensis]
MPSCISADRHAIVTRLTPVFVIVGQTLFSWSLWMTRPKREPLSEAELEFLVLLANGNALARQRRRERERQRAIRRCRYDTRR